MKMKKNYRLRLVSICILLGFFVSLVPGQALGAWVSSGPSAFPIYDIAVDPHNSNVYVVGKTDTIYKSTNAGESFTAIINPMFQGDSLTIVAVDSSVANTIFTAGLGLYRSLDGGLTWQVIGTGLPPATTISHSIKDILIDYENSDIVYVATLANDQLQNHEGGVYKSIDQGNTFIDITPTNQDVFLASSLSMDAVDTQTIYTGLDWNRNVRGLWKTQNAGISWTHIIFSQGDDPSIMALKADPEISGRLFVVAGHDAVDFIWKSNDFGQTFEAVFTSNIGLFGWSELAVHGTTVFCGSETGLFRSLNSGVIGTWTQLTGTIPDERLYEICLNGTTLFTGSPTWYVLYKSTDNGNVFNQRSVGFPRVSTLCVSSSTRVSSNTVYTGGNMNRPFTGRGLFKTTDNGRAWMQKPTNFQTLNLVKVAVCPNNQNIVLIMLIDEISGGHISCWSNNGGNSFSWVTGMETRALQFIFDPLNTNRVYAPIMRSGDVHFYRSENFGQSWTAVHDTGVTVDSDFSDMLVNNIEGPDVLYAGTTDGIFKSTDRGNTWVASGLAGQVITSLSLCAVTGGGIVAGTDNGVYRTLDNGVTWNHIGLAGIRINDVFSSSIESYVDRSPATYVRLILWAATNQGAYEYINGNWIERNAGLQSLNIKEFTLTKPFPFTTTQVTQTIVTQTTSVTSSVKVPVTTDIKKEQSQLTDQTLDKSTIKGSFIGDDNGGGSTICRARNDIPIRANRYSILHAATEAGTYEYTFYEH